MHVFHALTLKPTDNLEHVVRAWEEAVVPAATPTRARTAGTCKLLTEKPQNRGIEPVTFVLRGDGANHRAAASIEKQKSHVVIDVP